MIYGNPCILKNTVIKRFVSTAAMLYYSQLLKNNFHNRGKRSMNRIKVLIADDHLDFRRVIHDFLNRLPDVSVVGEAANGDDAVNKVEKLFPDVVLMDISMPLMNGIEATRIIKQRWPEMKVLIATNHDDPMRRKQAFEAHADGFILKGSMKPSLEAMFYVKHPHTPIPGTVPPIIERYNKNQQ